MPTATDLIRADERFHTRMSWLDSRHSFSFGHHHDPRNIGHGLLIVSNDDRVAAGGGFSTHPHRDMEIVTWVLSGELEHRDSEGNEGVIYPGLAQRMSAGTGILHSEMNHSATSDVHFVQMWVPPSAAGIRPGYEQLDVNADLDAGGLVPVASGRGHEGAITIHQDHASMWVARLSAGEAVELPASPFVHLFVATGEVELSQAEGAPADGLALAAGDAARLRDAGRPVVTAAAASEIIVWESDLEVRR
ncbi:MAG: pirin family protein [Acidimicrobiia bacterium]